MNASDDALDPLVERADDREAWIGVKQSDNEDRDADVRARVAEEIAAAIEAECDRSELIVQHGAYRHAARIARGFAA